MGQSRFDGINRFNISVSNSKNLKVVSFSPNSDSISVLNLNGEIKKLNASVFLALPIDGFVEAEFLDFNNDVSGLTSTFFLNFGNIKTDLTIIDTLRLFWASKTVSSKNVEIREISTALDRDAADKILGNLFFDQRLEKENQSVVIINTTSVSGLGLQVGRFVKNMGGKVVQISTENIPRKKSEILYNGEKTYTVERLNRIFGFKLSRVDRELVGDITIIIGEDNEGSNLF